METSFNLVIWSLLLIIGVFDSRECKIPNSSILVLLIISVFASTTYVGGDGLLLSRFSAFAVMFLATLILYVLKGIAAGDVKLAAVIGYILGWNSLDEYCWFFAFCCLFVGVMFRQLKNINNVDYIYVELCSTEGIKQSDSHKNVMDRKNTTHMPLAPVMIIALAMTNYFSHFA